MLSPWYFLYFLIIGAAVGWVAATVVKGRRYGLMVSMIVGVVGAILGGVIFQIFWVEASGRFGPMVTAALVGAVALSYINRYIKKS